MTITASSYIDLFVRQKSMELAQKIYRLVKLLPKEVTFSLSDQMRRVVVSVLSNMTNRCREDNS